MKSIRVLLADDHTLVRSGVKSLLSAMDAVEVVAEASDGLEAVKLAASERPDVVLMDIAMRGLNGLEAAARIGQQDPAIKVIILSMHDSAEYVDQALRSGVAGYVLKDAAPLELDFALQAVMRGETYLSPRVSSQVVQSLVDRSPAVSAESGLALLSPRQTEILKSIASGRTTKQIAFDLGVSIKTVETHRGQIMERLDIHDLAGLVRFAVRVGLVSAEN